jgi:hypothetical protein
MLVKPPAYFAELVYNEVLDAGVYLPLNPRDHSGKEMVHKFGMGLRLFHRKALSPGIVGSPVCERHEPQPAARSCFFSKPVNERAHPICVT